MYSFSVAFAQKMGIFINCLNWIHFIYLFQGSFIQCLQIFAQIDLQNNYDNFVEPVGFLLRSACRAVYYLKVSKTDYTVAVANGWEGVLCHIAKSSDYEKFFALLNFFIIPYNFSKYLPLFAELSPAEMDLSAWLQAIYTHLFCVLNNAAIVDDSSHSKRKEIYLQLTQVLLIFVKVEAKHASTFDNRWELNQSRRFLKGCQQFQLFQGNSESIKQYNICFELLNKLLLAFSSDVDNGKMAKAMQAFLARIK